MMADTEFELLSEFENELEEEALELEPLFSRREAIAQRFGKKEWGAFEFESFSDAERQAVQVLIGQEIHNENALADSVFFRRHPSRRGADLSPAKEENGSGFVTNLSARCSPLYPQMFLHGLVAC
jgi:hypothetical protein